MNDDQPKSPGRLLDSVAAFVLLLVIAALAWLIQVAYWPEYLRLASVEAEVMIMLGLLTAALILVSVVALRHTRA